MKPLKPFFLLFCFLPCIVFADSVKLVQSIPVETILTLAPNAAAPQQTWIEMIQQAKERIDIAQFYVTNKEGEALEPVIQELEKAGKRGVKIRFLLDTFNLKEDLITIERLKKIPGLTFRTFALSKLTGGVLHAKYWVIDNRYVYIGSQNFDWRSLSHIHETGVLLDNPVIAKQVEEIFQSDWVLAEKNQLNLKEVPAKSPEICLNNNAEVILVASPPALNSGVCSAEDYLIHLISSAKKEIRVQLLTYSTLEKYGSLDNKPRFWPVIDNALREAALLRKVSIELMVSDWNVKSPNSLAILKSLAEIPNITIKVITIPPASEEDIPFARVIHTKVMTVDNEILWVGTSNWSESYFHNSRNLELIIKNPELAKAANSSFEQLWNSPYSQNVLNIVPSPLPFPKESKSATQGEVFTK